MAVISETILPAEVNTDLSPYHLGSDKARFIRGIDYALFGGEKKGGNEYVLKPEESNKLYDSNFKLPAGESFAIGRKVSKKTNEVYVFAYNSLQNHFIYRIKDGKCEYVYLGKELGFVLNPEYFLQEGRVVVVPFYQGDKQKTFLIWTNFNETQFCLCVEDSIATDSFNSTKFPYFQTKYPKKEYITLGLRAFTECIQIKEVPTDNKSINKLKFKPWKFRLSGYDVYGRPLEHGAISAPAFIGDCASDSSQCYDLTFDVLSPLVDKIVIEFSNDGITWKQHDTISKYEECAGEYWERSFSKKYTLSDNKITYRFCPGEQCITIPSDAIRTYNPMPKVSNGVIELDDSIAFYNNKYGEKGLPCDVMDKIHFSIENPKPQEAPQTVISNRNITVWMILFNPYVMKYQAIWQLEGTNVWGGISDDLVEERVGGAYQQHLGAKDAEGFIGYLSDGSVAISKQYRYKYEQSSLIGWLPINGQMDNPEDWVDYGVVYNRKEVKNFAWIQKFEFKNIKPGKYLFRIAGHTASLQSDFKRTSTYFAGVNPIVQHGIDVRITDQSKELVVDVCEKDFDSMANGQIIQIWDLTKPEAKINLARQTRVSYGYLYESSDQGKGVNPISNGSVTINYSGDAEAIWTNHTDYNGFWYSAAKDKDHEVSVWINRNCQRTKIQMIDWNKNDGSGLKSKTFFVSSLWPNFQKEKCNRILIRGKVVECTTGKGIPNVTVALKDGGITTTNNKGEYELITYDWERLRNEPRTTRDDRLFFLAASKCKLLNCDNAVCIPSQVIQIPSCVNCNERIVTAKDTKLKFNVLNQKSLQLGGRYPFGIGVADWMDRKGFVNTKKEFILDVPTVNELGFWGAPKVKWWFDEGIKFDKGIERIYFYWGKNLKYDDFITWVADRVEFIDNTGNINTISPTQIRIYYSSLNEYNKQNNFSTNSTWQVIDEKDSLIITDQVHFIANGDGELFKDVITELVRSDKQGRYFQVDFNTALRDLKEGALFKLFREPECKSVESFYDVCESIEVVDGTPVKKGGYLEVFDSFIVDRQVPTPLVTSKRVKKAVTGSDPITYTEEEESETINVLKNYGWPFEHHSPSDFWGNKISSHGRPNVKNELEDIVYKPDEISVTGALATNANINFLHYFDNKQKKDFGKEHTPITACIARGNSVLVICHDRSFLTAYDDNTVRSGSDGTVRVLSGERQFSIPQNIGLNGCRQKDRNTIATNGNVVAWVDGNECGLVVHNFSNGQNIVKGKFESFLRRKIKSIDRSHKVQGQLFRYLHGTINEKNDSYYFTDFKIDNPSYFNNSDGAQIENNETACVDLQTLALRRFAHYTPELYAFLSGEETDKQMFSFKGALPYSHYNDSLSHLNFFGTQCQAFIRVAMAKDGIPKNFTSIEVYADNVVFYGKEVETQYKQKSILPRNIFKRVGKYWLAHFLCDKDTKVPINTTQNIDVLFDGEKLRGKWIEVLLITDPKNSNKYFELTGITINAVGIDG